MEPILQMLLSWQFIVFGLAIAALIFVIRQFIEYAISNWIKLSKKSKLLKLWNNLFLPILPVLLGALSGFLVKTYPYPNGLSTTGGRVVFGLVAGLMSGLLYRVIKSLLFQKVTVEPDSEKPKVEDSEKDSK